MGSHALCSITYVCVLVCSSYINWYTYVPVFSTSPSLLWTTMGYLSWWKQYYSNVDDDRYLATRTYITIKIGITYKIETYKIET